MVDVVPALFMPILKTLLPDVFMLPFEIEDETVRLAGVSTVSPVCVLAGVTEPPVPESVALTLTVIWLV